MKRKQTILLVDDNPKNLGILGTVLAESEHGLYFAKNGALALDIAKNKHPDLILLDIMMPDMDGFEVCRRLKQAPLLAEIPIIFLTAKTEKEDVIAGLELGAVDYVTKPFNKKELLTRVNTHLELQATREKLKEALIAKENALKQLAKQNKELYSKNAKLELLTQELAEAQKDKLFKLNKSYERFVPRMFLSLLGKKSIIDINLGEQIETKMTIMFTDIRGFTSISEAMTPQDNFDFINNYFGQMEPIILQYKGIIDKYIGDAIMALFPYSVDDALSAAIAMLKRLVEYNQILQTAGLPALQIGIGIHTGPLMLGTIGGQNRMDGTVISDAVNIAARIEELTKTYRTPLLISEASYLELSNTPKYLIRKLESVKVKGKSKYVNIFEVQINH
ncbi:response regulator [Candidatus Parabeggiatoa sp. HSG14]|uniref:response regulator n=1 Tax=Candidatus Parabeggiatoa sp. HSG14 TaxID=3055593 RepID=UPI0025A887CD|nr:response regulator [Thiotrichales bacterium HSG14]